MRGDSKNKIIFYLFLLLILLVLGVQMPAIKVQAKSKPKTTLIIGDSIPYGMALGKKYGTGVDGADKVYWLTEGGVTINFLHPDFKINLGKVMPKRIVNTFTNARKFDLLKEVKKKKIKDIVVMLGTNWPGEKSAKIVVSCLKKLAKKSGCRVYYVNTLPYVHKGVYKNIKVILENHNRLTKEGFKDTDIRYIDANKIAKSVKSYQSCTWDGIHYSKKVYNVIFKEILSSIEKENKEEKAESKQVLKEKRKKTDKKQEKETEN